MKHQIGNRVVFKADGESHRGRVTKLLHTKRRVVTDAGRRFEIPVARLRRSPDRVLVLEGRLDRSLHSSRHLAPMLRQWLSAYDVDVLHERVHTREALSQFLQREGRNVRTRFVHLIGHAVGRDSGESPQFQLTFEDVDLVEDVEIFRGLTGKILIFSCCDLGVEAKCMRTLKKVSGAAAVIAYRVGVDDTYTNMHEVLLYDRLIRTTHQPRTVVKQVGHGLYDLGLRPDETRLRSSALVVY